MNKTFITYSEALNLLETNKTNLATITLPLQEVEGNILAEDLIADRDFPPYDRVTMDGIAIKYSAFEKGNTSFKIQEVAPAGEAQKTLEDENHCIEIMTGAMLPINADTIIRYENLELENGYAKIVIGKIKERQNIHFKGIDIKAGTVVKKAGEKISSAEINVAAAIGKQTLLVKKMPKVVIISTGDELVDIDEIPLPHQIRRSNIYGIKSTLESWNINASLKHIADDKAAMEKIIKQFLQDFDVLIFTGGVSKGKFDFLPDVLKNLGVTKHFHKIQQRPGKPIWFGSKNDDTFIFGLPGNPVSSFVCLYVYVRFWLLKCLNIIDEPIYVTLADEVTFTPNLIYFLEAKLSYDKNGKTYALPILGNGSGDFLNLLKTDGFLMLPQEKQSFKKGEIYPFILYRNRF